MGECVRFEMGRAFGPFVDALRPMRAEPAVEEVAAHLTLSVRTAESHVDAIRTKLGLRTRAQIAAWITERETVLTH